MRAGKPVLKAVAAILFAGAVILVTTVAGHLRNAKDA